MLLPSIFTQYEDTQRRLVCPSNTEYNKYHKKDLCREEQTTAVAPFSIQLLYVCCHTCPHIAQGSSARRDNSYHNNKLFCVREDQTIVVTLFVDKRKFQGGNAALRGFSILWNAKSFPLSPFQVFYDIDFLKRNASGHFHFYSYWKSILIFPSGIEKPWDFIFTRRQRPPLKRIK